MGDPRSNSPRRYVVDVDGRRVLVGLTPEETSEFEGLDNSLPLLDGREAQSSEHPGSEPHLSPSGAEGRWLELYHKHDRAWVEWMADLRAEDDRNSPFFN
jgi:hypothetical protein